MKAMLFLYSGIVRNVGRKGFDRSTRADQGTTFSLLGSACVAAKTVESSEDFDNPKIANDEDEFESRRIE